MERGLCGVRNIGAANFSSLLFSADWPHLCSFPAVTCGYYALPLYGSPDRSWLLFRGTLRLLQTKILRRLLQTITLLVP
jgi:hypothetical protein